MKGFQKRIITLFLVVLLIAEITPISCLKITVLAEKSETTQSLYAQLTNAARELSVTIDTNGFFKEISGSEPRSIPISTPEELSAISNNLSGSYYLKNDIDLSDYGDWAPIGSWTYEYEDYYKSTNDVRATFTGTLNGWGHTIKGLTINYNDVDDNPENSNYDLYLGLFGAIGGSGNVTNLSLEDVSITVKTNRRAYIGAIVGMMKSSHRNSTSDSYTYVTNCKVSGQIGIDRKTYDASI